MTQQWSKGFLLQRRDMMANNRVLVRIGCLDIVTELLALLGSVAALLAD